MVRLNLEDSTFDCIKKLSEGNPGAIKVLGQLMKLDEVDAPPIGGLVSWVWLDEFGIYGSRIWMLYEDVCGRDPWDMFWVLRARQLGIISQADLDQRIDHHGFQDLAEIIDKAKAEILGDQSDE